MSQVICIGARKAPGDILLEHVQAIHHKRIGGESSQTCAQEFGMKKAVVKLASVIGDQNGTP